MATPDRGTHCAKLPLPITLLLPRQRPGPVLHQQAPRTSHHQHRQACRIRHQIHPPLNTAPSWLSPIQLASTPNQLPSAPVKLSDMQSAKRLRLVSLIVLGLTLSGLGVAQALGVAIPLAGYLAAALLVIGLTLVAATWLGMARGLLPVGILLAIAVLIVTAAGPALRVPVATASNHAYTNAGGAASRGRLRGLRQAFS